MSPATLTATETPAAEIPRISPVPPVPASLRETGLAVDQIERLLIKTLYTGEATGLVIADRLRLPYTLLEPLVERVRAEMLVEVRGSTGSG